MLRTIKQRAERLAWPGWRPGANPGMAR